MLTVPSIVAVAPFPARTSRWWKNLKIDRWNASDNRSNRCHHRHDNGCAHSTEIERIRIEEKSSIILLLLPKRTDDSRLVVVILVQVVLTQQLSFSELLVLWKKNIKKKYKQNLK